MRSRRRPTCFPPTCHDATPATWAGHWVMGSADPAKFAKLISAIYQERVSSSWAKTPDIGDSMAEQQKNQGNQGGQQSGGGSQGGGQQGGGQQGGGQQGGGGSQG